mmetsp:Transcript_6466/g.15315  ORF Transcript_6466/g.15315 Transcript_6466/m.15315 type:complete len:130 (-) Transcript_6466:212-601(-)
MGGTGMYPTYNNYTTKNNYSETVRLLYDTRHVTFEDVMDFYWKAAQVWGGPNCLWDPQPDPAYQLRVFAVNEKQRTIAEASKAALQAKPPIPNVTVQMTVFDASDYTFWKAEEYHQQFMRKEGYPCPAV